MDTAQMDRVLEMVSQLAIKVGTTTEFLWDVLVKQAYLTPVGFVIAGFTVVGFGFFFSFISKKAEKDADRLGLQEVAVILYGVAAVIAAFGAWAIVQVAFNPEYVALEKLMNLIGKANGGS